MTKKEFRFQTALPNRRQRRSGGPGWRPISDLGIDPDLIVTARGPPDRIKGRRRVGDPDEETREVIDNASTHGGFDESACAHRTIRV